MSSLSTPDAAGGLSAARRAESAAAHAAAVRRRERRAQWHLAFIVVFVLGPLVVYPLSRLVLLSLTDAHGLSLHAYIAFFGNPESRGVIGTTLWILFVSAGLASVLGVCLAAILFFRPFPGARLVTRFLELFVAFPSFLVAFTLIFLYGSQGSFSIALQRLLHRETPPLDFLFGIGGVVLAEVVFYAPFVVRPTLAAFALLDMRLVEAARSLGANSAMVAARVILPLAWPGIAAGTLLCFLLTFNEFGILLVLGSAHLITLPVAIYSAATVDLDLPTAAAGAVVMLAMSLSLYALYRRVDRRAGRGNRNGR
ncbi:2-aminoethylphosphonate ABC transporter permease subunit [Paraburkholderia caballeronis]|uniref:2-aminoethylphosphonate transport system permease protein n=1 Tax=Paraburkholderia caballeronis TaxID=416943 RepID=A0A1H7TN93_9BURK|nr:2-aminoethylphosphonate ABC transporter permease subunit [Paraburkholderia caballeronis]PXW17567.1 2-aminoethylphosphonate ABC transporter permease protein [Paraburkholderia caballeronis]PXW95312.1 2-aminoethylphosphonate ABC transporter permease protein [Paraburkholderia caballeronis]RAJ91126.1 2-aminoethylphosphonate ABC transporter permease protein [Paraburkholderia caballeronis]TDV26591.1 2-aminoethylphosphonate ABC transporter permease protein [Paraburkholderia caballeronis]SEE16486.1 